jgi:hypothetical protein
VSALGRQLLLNADNPSGSFAAACNAWHIGDSDSMSARDEYDPTLDAGYTTAGISHKAKLLIKLLRLWESPYTEYEGTSHFQATASSAKIGLLKSI